uniref:Uncharacterized protein n=1 Tax=Arundo donax TaxID=35708 RepID=A0A0A9EC74_ARUDO
MHSDYNFRILLNLKLRYAKTRASVEAQHYIYISLLMFLQNMYFRRTAMVSRTKDCQKQYPSVASDESECASSAYSSVYLTKSPTED